MTRLKSLSLILISTALLAGTQSAEALSGLSLLNTVADIESPSDRLLRYYPASGPATMSWRDSVSVSNAGICWDYNRQSHAVIAQNGSGHNMYRLQVDSYYKLGRQQSTVWGRAAFASGKTRNVKFADCIDFDLVAPFVLGDDTGGDLTHQQYTFGGGWTRRYGLWAIGVSADYRAEIAHRSHDPRVRDIVSDLGIRLGGARSIGSRYLMAVDATLRIYHQDCDIDYYNPANTIMTRLLTGMGSVYSRFDNNLCSSSGHDLTGFGAGITLMPSTDANGLRLRLGLTRNNAGTELRDFNNITLGNTKTTVIDGSATWLARTGTFSFMPTLEASLSHRKGIKNLFGMSSGSSYEKIGSQKSYSHSVAAISAALPVEWKPKGRLHSLSAIVKAGYISDKERLTDPQRSLSVGHLTESLDIVGQFRTRSLTMITVGFNAACSQADASAPQWGNLDMATNLGATVRANYEMLSANTHRLGGYATVEHVIAGKVLGLTATYANTGYHNMGHVNAATITLSLNF